MAEPSEAVVREARTAMRAGGYQCIEVRTGSKAPLARNWQMTRGSIPYRREAANTGHLVEETVPVDHDIDDAVQAALVAAIVERRFGVSPVHRGVTGSNKFMTFYLTTRLHRKLTVSFPSWPPNADGRLPKLELLGSTGQYLVPPSRHPSGSSYVWRHLGLGRGPGLVEKCDLPTVDESMVRALVEELCTLGGTLTVGSLDDDAAPSAIIAPPSEADATDAEAALMMLPVADYPHDAWVKLSRSACLAGVSFETFVAWCRPSPKFRTVGWLRDQWDCFIRTRRTNGVTAATLFGEVYERRPGWVKPSRGGPSDQDRTLPIAPSLLAPAEPVAVAISECHLDLVLTDAADAERAAAAVMLFLNRSRAGEVQTQTSERAPARRAKGTVPFAVKRRLRQLGRVLR